MTFGQQLRSDNDLRAPGLDVGKRLAQGIATCDDVAVEPGNIEIGKQRFELGRHALGACPDTNALGATDRAGPVQRFTSAAMMTAKLAGARMDRQLRVTALTLRRLLTSRAKQRGRETAAVDEQQHLVALLEMVTHGGQQRR